MNNEIIPFDFNNNTVRVVEEDGKVLFCGKDVATVLGYKDPVNALKLHCRGVAKYHPIIDSLGRTQEARFITEGDLYRLIASSKLPSAQKFESWVFDTVIPSIRRHGGYMAGQDHMTPEEMALASMRWLTSKVEEQAKLLQAQAPKVLFADSVATSKTSILVGELAKILKGNGVDIGQNRLFGWLRENKYLISKKGDLWNSPTQYSMELGLFEVKETTNQQPDGTVRINRTTKVTGKGQQYFINKFLNREGSTL